MYTYAFFKTPSTPLQLTEGIAGNLAVIKTDSLSALVEPDLEFEAIEKDDTQLVQAVLTHDRVICDLFWQVTILPLRFGTQFLSHDRLVAHLSENRDKYLEKLNQLEGKAEYRLKLTPIELELLANPETNGSMKGRDYFQAKKQQYQAHIDQKDQQQQEFEQILAEIEQVYPDTKVKPGADGIEKLYLLIDKREEMMLYQRLNEWQNQYPHWELGLGEALPPYHFV
ncbi:GvpL/GvpF family gas vesicle protein [Pseudanabaenaceae cyanobacterium LEGE 13415]|nr:GvpL/GvpF family gas vesicle protein [Pseudanabaenaceae cyanobacterium LEGE 13415]